MKIVTLTLNPALDKSAKVDCIAPGHKLKCHSINYQPGGGGINISRLLSRLGIENTCIFPRGGDNGNLLNELLIKENIQPHSIHIKEWTRENLSVTDTQTGFQYRFGMPGHLLSDSELLEIEAVLGQLIDDNDILVLSGSLCREMSLEYYATLIRSLAGRNIRFILDSSGLAIKEALETGLYLIKPNQRELAQLAGKDYLSNDEQEQFALEIIKTYNIRYVVVSQGSRGAFIASREGISYTPAPSVITKSTIGAGDSMVAGLIYAMQMNCSPELMLQWGVACGVATTMTEGTGLASKENIDKVFAMISKMS